jgi:ABC-type dipeptide/oligopeptide/nickel transport system ATPase component
MLWIRDLHSWFAMDSGVVRAVNGVSLRVDAGQRVGIVGESGSGKTQTFFAALGLARGRPGVVSGSARVAGVEVLEGLSSYVRVTDGTVNKDDVRWRRLERARLRRVMGTDVTMMFQDARRSLVPYWTVGRHLAKLSRRSSDDCPDALDLLSTLGFRDPRRVAASYPGQLSGGEAQRAMLSLVLAMRPKLLVADEPTTGLDALNQARMLDALGDAQSSSGFALAFISHDLAIVEGVVDYVFVFFGGRVVEHGPKLILSGADFVHPYTNELRASQVRRARGLPIDPATARPTHPIAQVGCPFAARCVLRPTLSQAMQVRCATEPPPLFEVGVAHNVACWGATA